ncbi:hypothetical protein [Pedobacter frigoris]|uniref:Uncharacterized protein n=1 Tax=Pedobacter frigoris TaxID=2571272 RepID=A0A4U1CK12_9SPHI|nr:hypothetical protein [Pedobacter frigoris]TKC06956.1 hypothetical protein FA047_06705 [Pedobacter frigoris]
MKNTILFAAFLLLTAYSYGQTEKADQQSIRMDTIKGWGGALDTVITRKTELSFNKIFPNNYKKDKSVLKALRPYLVSDIVDPTNHSHPFYLERLKNAKEKLPLAKSELLELMKASPDYRQKMAKFNITSEADLNSINFVHVPMYYITPNIVFFKNGENIAKYYNLGRGGLKYLAFKNNRLLGYLDFYEKRSSFKSEFIPALQPSVESYNQIIKMGETPIALNQSISKDPKNVGGGGHVHMFGYVDQEHLIFSYYSEGVVKKVATDAYVAPDPRFHKEYTLQTAEAFFSGSGSRSTLSRWLDNTISTLTIIAQTGSKVKFNLLKEPSATDKNLITVNGAINAKQPISGKGIHFTLIVENNSSNAISIKNIADVLTVALYNKLGFDIAVPNNALAPINRHPDDRKWRFRSESVVPDKFYINGKEEKSNLKNQQYIEIPAGGNCKVNLRIKDVKQVETPQDVQNKLLGPTIKLAPGNYKLKLYLIIASAQQNSLGAYGGVYLSPMIDIDYR